MNAAELKDVRTSSLQIAQLFLNIGQLTRAFRDALPHVQKKHTVGLMADFHRTVMGKTLSAGGLAGALLHLTEGDVFEPERAYLSSLSGLLKKARNSMCGLELDADISGEQIGAAYAAGGHDKTMALGIVHESIKIVDLAIENLALQP